MANIIYAQEQPTRAHHIRYRQDKLKIKIEKFIKRVNRQQQQTRSIEHEELETKHSCSVADDD